METKQTAVEWSYDQITRTYWDYMTSEEQNLLFEQAKQMHKEQIMKANLDGFIQAHDFAPEKYVKTSEDYYNENYGK